MLSENTIARLQALSLQEHSKANLEHICAGVRRAKIATYRAQAQRGEISGVTKLVLEQLLEQQETFNQREIAFRSLLP